MQRRMIDLHPLAWSCQVSVKTFQHVFSAGVTHGEQVAESKRCKAVRQVPPMMLVEHQCVDQCKVARLVEQRAWVVLQTEVGVPHNDTVQRDAVLTRVHETKGNVVAAHKHRKRVFAGN
jgi:hypothetical protein